MPYLIYKKGLEALASPHFTYILMAPLRELNNLGKI